jgi:RNA polymerase sigma factor (sigma-70 family)
LHSLSSILRKVRSFRGDDAGAVSDGELLRRFQVQGDEAAFELIVWRHGPMVLGVCRRILRDEHLAEDTFQATFLTLAQKAGAIGVRDAIPGWLYTVAHRAALAARARQARRAIVEPLADLTGIDQPAYLQADETAENEERHLLRQEVDRLPDAFRSVIVLCCLEGRSQAEAAEQLGVPTGTVESRLVRGRERLRRGLTARGLAMAAAPFVDFLAEHAGDLIKVSPVLVHSTMHLVLLFKFGALAAAGTTAELITEAGWASARMFRLTQTAALVAMVALGAGAFVLASSPPGEPPAALSIAPPMPSPAAPEIKQPTPALTTSRACRHQYP